MESLSDFFSSLIPIATGILSAGGNLSSASVQAFNMNLTLAAVSKIFTSVLLPLSSAMFALSLAGSMDGGAVSSLANRYPDHAIAVREGDCLPTKYIKVGKKFKSIYVEGSPAEFCIRYKTSF